jgi:hypothetical protein
MHQELLSRGSRSQTEKDETRCFRAPLSLSLYIYIYIYRERERERERGRRDLGAAGGEEYDQKMYKKV